MAAQQQCAKTRYAWLLGPQPGSDLPGQAPTPPVTLRISFHAAQLMALCTAIGTMLIFAIGREYVDEGATGYPSMRPFGDLGPDAQGDVVYNLMVGRAVVDLAAMAVTLIFAFYARRGTTWARATVTVLLLLGIPLRLLELIGAPGSYQVIVALVVLVSPIVPVLLFLPSSNRFNRAGTTAHRI